MSVFSLNQSEVEVLEKSIQDYSGDAEDVITRYLHGQGYEQLEEGIRRLIPDSRRNKSNYKEHREHAVDSKSLMDRQKNSNLSVTIGTTKDFHYLYFPDDGTDTVHHAGNQQFFFKGVQNEEENVINGILDQLKFPIS